MSNQENQLLFHPTSFSNISKISLGDCHSLFQNEEDEIYSCGTNRNGEFGLGHSNHPQITPSLIPNLPSNIIQFVCGNGQNLFLDSEGNVFSVGKHYFGSLGHDLDKENILKQIPNIPPMQTISCVGFSSYLIDFEGKIWSFGQNSKGRLGQVI